MRRRRKAFTLVELLTVIAVIILVLTAALVPTLQAVRRRAKTVICANNLKRLAQAVSTRRSDELQGRVPRLSASRWRTQLAPYLPVDSNELVCPEYDPDKAPPRVEDTFRFKMWATGYGSYYVNLDGSNVAKMSDSQYKAARAAGYLTHNAKWADYTEYQGYEDDGSGVVWYALEENDGTHKYQAGVAHDFEEVRMRVQDNGDGTVEVSFDIGSHNTGISIVPANSDKPLRVLGGPTGGGQMAEPVTVAATAADPASYGVNASASRLQKPGKILAVDYVWTVASPKHNWASMGYGKDPGAPKFARHRGLMNVAFLDGSVQLLQPQQIDPKSEQVRETYWLASP